MSAGAIEIFITHYDQDNVERFRVITIKSLDLAGPSYTIHHVDDTTEEIHRDWVTYMEIHTNT